MSALADRFSACKLVLHPVKTKIVSCKDRTDTRLPYHLVRLSGIPVSGPEDDVEGRHEAHLRAQLPTRRQPEGVDVHSPNDPAQEVRNVLGPEWKTSVLDWRLTPERLAKLNLNCNSVRKIGFAEAIR